MEYIPVRRAQSRKNEKFSSTELHTGGYIRLISSGWSSLSGQSVQEYKTQSFKV